MFGLQLRPEMIKNLCEVFEVREAERGVNTCLFGFGIDSFRFLSVGKSPASL